MSDALASWLVRAAACGERGIRLLDRHQGERWLAWDGLVHARDTPAGCRRYDRGAALASRQASLPRRLPSPYLTMAPLRTAPPPARLGALDE